MAAGARGGGTSWTGGRSAVGPFTSEPQGKPILPPQSDLSLKPTIKPDAVQGVPGRPYNLDQLLSDRAKAEADLDNMMSEMRGRMKGR